ncbi:MAG: ATP-binding protein [Mariprofundaceae bacterium]|nr:ATP-binding protein [Mariprofundaceae bacterium]
MFQTFRARLAILYIAIHCIVLGLSGFLIYEVLSRQIYDAIDTELTVKSAEITKKLKQTPFRNWMQLLQNRPNSSEMQLIGSNGILLYSTGERLSTQMSKELRQALHRSIAGQTLFITTGTLLAENSLRVVTTPTYREDRIVAVLVMAHEMGEAHAFFQLLYIVGGILGFISILISSFAGYILAQRALKPIQEVTIVARKVAEGDLKKRITSFSKDKEISELISSLNKMFSDLDASFSAQQRFTADASHELRIPLTIMRGEAEVALKKHREEEEYRDILSQQLNMVERMRSIVNGLLLLAKADSGQLHMAEDDVDIGLCVQEAFQSNLMMFSGDDIHLDLDMDEDAEIYICGDAEQLQGVLFNLLSNAFKYSDPSDHVTLSMKVKEQRLWIGIRDQGPGMEQQHLQHLFDRFYRADKSRDRNKGGAGLGLAICKQVIEVHHGSIDVESEVDVGTCFNIYLPILRVMS